MKMYEVTRKGCAVFAKQDERNKKLFVACSAEDGGERHLLPVGSILKTDNPAVNKMRSVTAVIADEDETRRADEAEAMVEELKVKLAKKGSSKGDDKALKASDAKVTKLEAAAVKGAKALEDAIAEVKTLKSSLTNGAKALKASEAKVTKLEAKSAPAKLAGT